MDERTAPTRRASRGLAFLGAVAGGLVHEISNPLSDAELNLQLMEEEWPEAEGDDRARRTLERVAARCAGRSRRLEAILDDFLRYAGIRRLDLADADLNRVLEEIDHLLRARVRARGRRPRLLPRPPPAARPLDERLVKQALLNLLLNAVQAMEEMAARGGPPPSS